jgi:hypothetical protein
LGLRPWKRSPWRSAFSLGFVLWLAGPAARADASPRQLSVLNAVNAGVSEAQTAAVDRVLREALAQRLQGSKVETSPVPFEDVQLVAGCGSDEPTCLQQIANQLGSDALLVRRLAAQPDGSALLTLTAYDVQAVPPGSHADPSLGSTPPVSLAPPAAPRQVSTRINWTVPQAAESAVLQLLAQLQAEPSAPPPAVLPPPVVEVEAQPIPPSAPLAAPTRWQSRLGWSMAAVGCGLIAGGMISGAASRRDEQTYADLVIDDAEAVDEAHALLTSAQRHARIANGLFIAGAVTTTAGLATVLWRWAALRKDARPTALSLQPARSGLMLSISGSWQGGF